jgi:hypothetical protein
VGEAGRGRPKNSLPQNSAEGYGKPKDKKSAGETRQKIAEKAGVSRDTVRKVQKVEKEADEETKEQAATGHNPARVHRKRTGGRMGRSRSFPTLYELDDAFPRSSTVTLPRG